MLAMALDYNKSWGGMKLTNLQKRLAAILLLLASTQTWAQVDCDNFYNPLVNCGFETGDFSGWTVTDLTTPFIPAQVVPAGLSIGFGFFLTAPTQGSMLAINGFDGDGPGTIEYFQDVFMPAGAAELSFDYQAAWDLVNFCGGCTGSRLFTVEIQPAGGGAAIISSVILTADPGTRSTLQRQRKKIPEPEESRTRIGLGCP